MDYEKKYKEALEKARQLCAYPTTKPFISDLQNLFPELAESKDERIRKALIDFFSEPGRKEYILNGFTVDDILAWLEKQGEQKPAWSEEDEAIFAKISDLLWEGYKQSRSNLSWNDIRKWVGHKLKSLRHQNTWKSGDLPHWKKSTLPNDNITGFNSDYFCHNGYYINYKELFEKLPKDD